MAKGARRNWCIWATCSWTIVREPGKAFSAGDLGLTGGLAGLQEGLSLDGLAKEFDDSGCLGNRWCYWRGPTLRDGAHDPVGGPESDLHSLFPVSGNQGAVAVRGYVDDAEPNLRLRDAGPAVSSPAHLGSCVAWGGASRRG